MEGTDAGVLLELNRGERTIGGPELGLRGLHAVEGLAADTGGRLEALDGHGEGAVVSAALEHARRDVHARQLAQQIASLEADALRAQVARRVVCDRAAGRALECRREARL